MFKFTPTSGVVAPATLAIAAASLLLAGAAMTPSFAQADQAPHAMHSMATKAATSMKPGSVEERISQLKTQLKITPNEESDWNGVADAMRQNAKDMQQLVDQTRSAGPRDRRNALEDLQTYQKFAQAHADGLQKLTSAFGTLYNAMPPGQKANADKVFRTFERRRPSSHG